MTSTVVPPPSSGEPREFYDSALLRLSRLRVTAGPAAEAVLRAAGEIITSTLRVARVGIWMFLGDGSAIRCDYLYQHSRLESCEGMLLHAEDFPVYFRAIMASRAVPVSDVDGSAMVDEFRDSYLEPLGITSMLDVPIYRSGRVVGIVCHEHIGPPRLWTDLERDFACSVGDIAGRLLEEASRRAAQQMLAGNAHHLAAVQRVSDLAHLASGIAHDFNNVLGAIVGSTDLIRESSADRPDILEVTRTLDEAVHSGRRLTGALLAFGRDEAQRPRVVDLTGVIEASRPLLAASAGRELSLELRLAEDVSRVFVDPVQIERLLLNLVVNARDATPPGGRVTIALSEACRTDRGHGSGYVLLEVSDTGIGIEPSVRDRVLEPFFTTKGSKGTGLGLSIVNHVATRAGGFVEIESERDRGTAIRVFLPRIAARDRRGQRPAWVAT